MALCFFKVYLQREFHKNPITFLSNLINITKKKDFERKFIIITFFLFSCLKSSYCDVFQKCREVDPSGPLATLRKLLLSEESIATFKKWMQTNWYTVALAVIGVLTLLVSFKFPNSRFSIVQVENYTICIVTCQDFSSDFTDKKR